MDSMHAQVIGPVTQPFYVLRWAGSGKPPGSLAPGALVSALTRMAHKVAPEVLVSVYSKDLSENLYQCPIQGPRDNV
jgi:hypothetical protein